MLTIYAAVRVHSFSELPICAALRVNSYSELQLGEHATDFLAARAAKQPGLVSADTNTSNTDTLQTPDATNSQHPRMHQNDG